MMLTSQDIITCDICKQEPLHHFCNGCEIRLCKNCVVTHLESESLEGHTIVQYKHRDARNIQPRTCHDHPSMHKILYCKKCSAQICLSCIAEHGDHMLEVVDLKQFVNSQYMEIVKILEHLNIKSLPKCRLSIEKMRALLEEANTKYDQERQKIFDVGEVLHHKIKEEVDDLLAEIDKQKKETLEKLQDLIKCTEEKLQEIDETLEMCEATKSSLDEILKFTFDESSLDIAQTIEVTFPQFKTPRACTLDVGLLKSVREERRLIDKPLEEDIPEKETKKEGECQVQILFIENLHAKPIDNLLKNCRRYKEELRFDKELDEASAEYRILLKKSTSTESRKNSPPYEINLFDDEEKRCQAPFLYDIISLISKTYPNTRWKKAMAEFIGLTPPIGPKRQVFTADEHKIFTTYEEEEEKRKPFEFEKEKVDEGEKDSKAMPQSEILKIEDQSKSKNYKEEEKEEEVFHDAMDGENKEHKPPVVNVMFLENANLQPIAYFLENCLRYKDDFQFGGELDEAVNEYKCLLKKAKETGCPVQKNPPPSQLNAVTPSEKLQAPCLYEVISDVAKRCPNAKWMDAVTEFITLTTISQSEPRHAKHQRPRSTSGYQKKKEKEYRNSIEKLLDQEWDPEFIPKAAVEYDYRHFYTSESVLRSSFPDAYIFNMASSALSNPDDVPLEFRERTLFNFLLSIDMKKYGVKPEDAWRDFGRCILAEKQLDLARRAVGPDLGKNVIVSKHNFYKLQNEVKEKTEEIEELSTRLTKFTQLTEGNLNIEVLLSDVHRPTSLGEMYSRLFDDEWSEAFEAFKPKTDEDDEDDDDDIFPETLFILQNVLIEISRFCQRKAETHKTTLAKALTIVLDDGNKVEKIAIGEELQHLQWTLASKTTKIIQNLFLQQELSNLVTDEGLREDLRTLTYVR